MNPASVLLKTDLVAYRDSGLSKQERQAQGIDGSEAELEIVSSFLRADSEEEEIFDYFERYRSPRYSEEPNGKSWVSYLIQEAKKSEESYKKHSRTDDEGHQAPPHTSLRVVENEQSLGVGGRDGGVKRQYNDVTFPFWILNRRLLGEERGEYPTLMEWYEEIREVSGQQITKPVSLSTARRKGKKLREKGYVETRRMGRTERVRLTNRGRKNGVPQMGGWPRVVWLGEAKPSEAMAQTLEEFLGEADSLIDAADGDAKTKSRKTAPQKRRSTEQERSSRILKLRRKQRLNEFYRLTFPGKKKRYIQILTPREEWTLGNLWEQKLVGQDNEGLPVFRSVATNEFDTKRLDPNGWNPKTRRLAIAAELVHDGDEYRIAEYDDEQGELHPAIGVISQSEFNFWANLAADDPCSKIFLIRGSGQGKKRAYHFEAVGDAIDITPPIDLEDVIASLELRETEAVFERLPVGWFAMPEGRQRLLHRLGCVPELEPVESSSGRPL